MGEEVIFLKGDHEQTTTKKPGKLYRMMVKSGKMEAIISELDPHASSRWYKHQGEELHFVIEGELEYDVGEKTYKMGKGDMLWHSSSVKHRAKNHGDTKVKYITVGTPPTFM